MKVRLVVPVSLVVLAVAGCLGPEAGPVPKDQIKTGVSVDPAVAEAGIESQRQKIRSSNLTEEQKEKALKLLGSKP